MLLASQLLYDWGPRGIVWLDALTFFSYFYLGILFFDACRLFFFSTRPHSSSPPTHPPWVAYGKEIVLPDWHRDTAGYFTWRNYTFHPWTFFLSFEFSFRFEAHTFFHRHFFFRLTFPPEILFALGMNRKNKEWWHCFRGWTHKCYDPPGICCSLEIFIFFIQNNPREKLGGVNFFFFCSGSRRSFFEDDNALQGLFFFLPFRNFFCAHQQKIKVQSTNTDAIHLVK